MGYLLLLLFVLMVVFFPMLRCGLFNLHFVGYYGVRDIYKYFKNCEWRVWNGKVRFLRMLQS